MIKQRLELFSKYLHKAKNLLDKLLNFFVWLHFLIRLLIIFIFVAWEDENTPVSLLPPN